MDYRTRDKDAAERAITTELACPVLEAVHSVASRRRAG